MPAQTDETETVDRGQFKFLKQTASWYLHVSLVFNGAKKFELTEVAYKQQIHKSLKQLFGEAGSAIEVGILKFNPLSGSAILTCPSDSFVKVRSALVMIVTDFSGAECYFKVHRVSANLLSFTTNSRTFEF